MGSIPTHPRRLKGRSWRQGIVEISNVSATAIDARNLEIPRPGKGGRIKIIVRSKLITAILSESGKDIFKQISHTWNYATVTIPAKGPAYFSADIPNDSLYILFCDCDICNPRANPCRTNQGLPNRERMFYQSNES